MRGQLFHHNRLTAPELERPPSPSLVKLVHDVLDTEARATRTSCHNASGETLHASVARVRRQLEKQLLAVGPDSPDCAFSEIVRAYLESTAAADAFTPERNQAAAVANRRLHQALYRLARVSRTERSVQPDRIVVAVSDGPRSASLLDTAGRLAESLPAVLKLVHVIPDTPAVAMTEPSADHDRRLRAATMLRAARSELPPGVDCETLVRQGDAAAEVVGSARRWGADFILLGLSSAEPPGHTGRSMTPVVVAVMEAAPCPVLTVGQKALSYAERQTTGGRNDANTAIGSRRTAGADGVRTQT